MTQSLLIDSETLQQNLGRDGLVIIDVRGSAAYAAGGHIPGAVHATWHEFSDPKAVAKGLLNPDHAAVEKKLQSIGLHQDSDVVIYSNPFDNWGDEGRMYWMLEYFGHTKLSILDGGWVKWVHERRPFEYGVTQVPAGNFRIALQEQHIIEKSELKKLVKQPKPERVILDARSLEEYVGKEVSGIPRPGHIPGAISVPWNNFLNPDATVKDANNIIADLEEQGIEPNQEIICYCTGGVRSAWLYLVLKLVGFSKIRNYPGSWWEWSRDFAAPVEKDANILKKFVEDEPSLPS